MPTITSSVQLRLRRRVPSILLEAVIAAVPFAILYYNRWHPTYVRAWLQIGVPFVLTALVRTLRLTKGQPPPAVSWDHEGLLIQEGSERTEIPWRDFEEYRFTWDIPRQLKLRRWSSWGTAVKVDLAGFDDDQRSALTRELDLHVALPNRRLERTREMIKE